MEVWRTETPEQPKVMGLRNFGIAFGLHLALFLVFLTYGLCTDLFRKDEEIVPIDLTVVVVENLDGNEDEPPPMEKPQPEPPPPPPPPPPPKPQPKPKEPDPPKELEKIVTNIVEKTEKKIEKPEPPKKTEKQLKEERRKKELERRKKLEERMRKARESAKVVKTTTYAKPQPNGRTDRKTLTDAEIQKLLNAGYRPGRSTNLAASEEQLAYSLIKREFEAKWDEPPWTDTLKPMIIRVWFGPGGRIVNFKLEQSSGDRSADQTIKSAASRVGVVRNLSPDFIEKYRHGGVPIRFTVKPQ